MNIEKYYNQESNGISFTREQASQFAKNVADDFNPIHDIDAKRFCVPGDLLFAVALSRLGLFNAMQATFSNMVTNGIELLFKQTDANNLDIMNNDGKKYLNLQHQGGNTTNQAAINQLIEQYVGFSGKTFPHILVPLWKDKNVMVNPARPLVIYQSMSINMDSLDFTNPILEATTPELSVEGKRGHVVLRFDFKYGDKKIGSGEKRMILSGLKPYDQTNFVLAVHIN
jgi:hypothetical protein